ncbi:MAG: MMPL family transporter [Planctomycetes bacterium]|nr:MMPL family transporter [Planctomycetota bacterium]
MRGPLNQLFDFLKRRPVILPVALLLLLLGALIGALRVDFREDVFALLPRDEPLVTEARLAIDRFSGLERMVIALESDDHGLLTAGVDHVETELRNLAHVKSVVARIDPDAQDDIGHLYLGRAPLLFDAPMRQEVEKRLTTEYFEQGFQRFYDAQAGAEGIKIVDSFTGDPFGFDELTLRRFERLNSGFAGRPDARGRIISNDGRVAVIMVELDFPSSDTGAGRAFFELLDARLGELPEGVTPHVIGAHRSSVDNAVVLRDDMNITIATSIIGILLLFVFAFRALSPIVITLLSVGFGFAMALGSQGWLHGELSAITAGFSAVLLGISVDYAIHLVTTYGSLDGDREERAVGALRHVARPGFIAMVTTVLAILMLRFSEFDGLHQLAEMAIAGIAGSLVFAFTAGAQLLRKVGPKPGAAAPVGALIGALQRARRRGGVALLVVVCVITVALAMFLPGVSFDGDVMNLDGKSERTRASEALVRQTFGQETLSRTLLVVGGDDLESALRGNDLAARDLYELGAQFESAAWVLPARQTQQENLEHWKRFFNDARIAQIKSLMAKARVTHPNDGRVLELTEARLERAFKEFFARLRLESPPALLEPLQLKERPIWLLLGNFVSERNGRTYIGTTARLDAARLGELKARQPSGVVLNKAAFVGRMIEFIRRDLILMGGLSLVLVLVVLGLTFRNLREVLTALVPVGGGMIWTLGLMSLLGIPFNIINTLVTVFIAGLGIDYGIFFVQTYRGSANREEADRRLRHAGAGVLIAALTTLFGFGSLALAQHPALFSVGVTTAIGVASALVLTLTVVPTLLEMKQHEN